jgi:DNA-binding protein YbaB
MRLLLVSCQRQLAEAQQLTRDLSEHTSQAQSPDRMITVTVDGTGALTQLSLDRDTFEHHTPTSLASAVTKAAQQAVRQLSSSAAADLEGDTPPAQLKPEPAAVAPAVVSEVVPVVEQQQQHVVVVNPPDPMPVPIPVPVPIQDPPPPPPDQAPDSGSQIDHVVSALSRLPSYTGVVTRVLGVRDPERAAEIASQYEPGETIIERTFLSTSANPAYTGDGLVRYTIEAKHNGKLIGAISQDGEAFGEVVFGPGCRFRVTGKRFYPSMRGWDIALEEMD